MTDLAQNDIRERAAALDRSDELATFRDRFHIPKDAAGDDVLYFTGNSLGLQPATARREIETVLDEWARLGVHAHFDASLPWMPYHENLTAPMARIVGAKETETVVMNSLTVNLHLLMASFYRPNGRRRKIAIERHAFPSDRYAVRSHLAFRGADPERDLVLLGDEGDSAPDDARLEEQIGRCGDELALVLLGGVNYYSGQVFDIARLSAAAHRAGTMFGVDLAHGAGNVELMLHDWDVDFAAWCSYKYLNAGPGGPSGVFIHEKHATNPDTPRLAGWWGHEKSSRFEMPDRFTPIPTAEGWQLSNPPILSLAALKSSLSIFDEAGMDRLSRKSASLTGFLRDALTERLPDAIEIITPEEPGRHGAQLSLRVRSSAGAGHARSIHERLENGGVVCDWREPDVIRVAPVPLYNTFGDVARFVARLQEAIEG